jgi:hypothetical protein
MEDASFRRFLRTVFENSHVWEMSYDNSGSLTAFREGERAVGLMIWNKLSRSQQGKLIMEENDGNVAK